MIVDLTEYKRYLEKIAQKRMLDMEASCVILEECLKLLNINDLPELETIKRQIKDAISRLEKTDG